MTMTKNEITRAIIDGDMDAIEALAVAFTKAKYNEDGDALTELAEAIKVAVRADTVSDVVVDLRDSDYADAADMIEINY